MSANKHAVPEVLMPSIWRLPIVAMIYSELAIASPMPTQHDY